ncbi:MAG: RDD family protein [Hoeflea sp.]|uniref:RDD family protein n=1 Tax=Hoeflea sp. TaxID=1940281 RepID=UPI001DA1F5E3|nr:RDD family protein [Hoeflea sp.]MBU4530051.1 RDD family protein [Alphaproteobacteria bacterium]MBU4542664.1 RDD family protein [Alphaproteobacteria bacterium]MBU4551345.1 RDD family protein [Alphaproteobacteria bacterium]MBV1723168.1 RDD family protein [Hoeflea sp.]MBV1760179.1 RDD family protein [Hoeflea sp.]
MSRPFPDSASDPAISAYDDIALYDGVRTKRVLAFFIDYAIVLALCVPVAVLIFFIGIFTLGLGFFLYPILFLLVAIPYIGMSMGGPNQATPGMRMMGIRVARLDGRPVDFMLAVVHGVLFWALNAILTPFILLATLVLNRKQTVHDWLLGTVVVRG